MDYSVKVTIRTRRALTASALEAVAEIGGYAAGDIGGRRLSTTLTVAADSAIDATRIGAERITAIVPGVVLAVDAATIEERDREEEASADLVGITDVGKMLEVSRQRAHSVSKHKKFPPPVKRLSTGPVWRREEVYRFAAKWERKPGRPKDAKREAT